MQTENRRKFIINFTYFLIIAVLVYAAMKYALPVLAPFALAVVFAYFLNRPINWFSRKTKLPRNASALIFVIGFYIVLAGLIALISWGLVEVGIKLVNGLPNFYANVLEPDIQLLLDSIEKIGKHSTPEFAALMEDMEAKLFESLGTMVSNLSMTLVGFLTGLVVKVPGTIINIIVMIISTFFLNIDYNKVYGFLLNQFGERARNIVGQVEYFIFHTLLIVIRSYILIMSITFCELSIGLSIVGIRNPIVTAFCISIFDILPVLGTGGIMLPWVIISVIQGRFGRALALLCVYLIVTVIRNILEPKIVGGNLGLHPVLTLASMFAGVNMFGILGLFGFPITLSLFKHMNDNGTITVYKPIEKDPTEEEKETKRHKRSTKTNKEE
ncbi:MAG: sporulation integral membrane protein YtvI [Firmicutes bacterium]|nr:sporulation integral membrane protein YtvI [Bacillota bacterium]